MSEAVVLLQLNTCTLRILGSHTSASSHQPPPPPLLAAAPFLYKANSGANIATPLVYKRTNGGIKTLNISHLPSLSLSDRHSSK